MGLEHQKSVPVSVLIFLMIQIREKLVIVSVTFVKREAWCTDLPRPKSVVHEHVRQPCELDGKPTTFVALVFLPLEAPTPNEHSVENYENWHTCSTVSDSQDTCLTFRGDLVGTHSEPSRVREVNAPNFPCFEVGYEVIDGGVHVTDTRAVRGRVEVRNRKADAELALEIGHCNKRTGRMGTR